MQRRRHGGLHWIRVLCLLAVAFPNCTRCCPTGSGCQCNWAWENCPPSSGCGSCANAETLSAAGPIEPPEAGASFHAKSPATIAVDAGPVDERGGTLAFVATDAGTFAVAALAGLDEVRILRVDANDLDEDPITVRTVGAIALDGDRPTRVVADGRGHAIVALREAGAVAAVDPLTTSVARRAAVCAAPNGLTADPARDALWVACGSGDVVALGASDESELRRVSLGGDLHDVAIAGNGVIADPGDAVARCFAAGFSRDDALPGEVTDFFALGAATAVVADGDAFFRASPSEPLARVVGGLETRAVAIADVAGEKATRRVLAVQTVRPRLLVFFTVPGVPSAAAVEPLE